MTKDNSSFEQSGNAPSAEKSENSQAAYEDKTYSELFAELKKTVAALEADQSNLEESMNLYKKAIMLSKRCRSVLGGMEEEIKKLSADGDGQVIAEDFSEGGQRLC